MTQNRGTWSADAMGGPPGAGAGGFGSPPSQVPPPPPPEAQRDGPAWERRAGILDLGAMFATVRDVLFDASRAFATMIRVLEEGFSDEIDHVRDRRRGVVGVAIDFGTWRQLVARAGLSAEEAVDLMIGLVTSADGGQPGT